MDNLMIGGVAAVVSRTFTAPLELYKIQTQNRYLKDSTLRNVVKKEGLRYLWKGSYQNWAQSRQRPTNSTSGDCYKKFGVGNLT